MLRKAANRADIVENQILGVEIEGRKVALYLVDGALFATDDECPHVGGLLSEDGVVDGAEVECSCHGSRFLIATGETTMPPANTPLAVYPAEANGAEVLIDLE